MPENVFIRVLNRINRKKLFYLACVINFVVYWILFCPVFYYTLGSELGLGDFFVTYKPAVEYFLADPNTIYDPAGFVTLRSLPLALFYYLALFQIPGPVEAKFFTSSLILMVWNAGICFVLWKIMGTKKIQEIRGNAIFKDKYMVLTFYLLIPWQAIEYWIVSSDTITLFFMLLGIYFYLTEKRNWSFFFWSFAANFKIFPIFLLLFIFFEKDVLSFIKRAVFAIAAQIPTLLYFITWPGSLGGYFFNNSSADFYRSDASGSFARDIIRLFSLPAIETTIIIALFVLPLQFYYVIIKYQDKLNISDKFLLVFLTGLMIFPEFYVNHNLVFLGVYIIWLFTDNQIYKKKIKLIPLFPVVFIPIWLLFPYISIFYVLPLFIVDFAVITHDKKESSLSLNKNAQIPVANK